MSSRTVAHRAGVPAGLSDPVTAVLLWGLVLLGRLDMDLCALLGVKDVDRATIEVAFAQPLQELRAMQSAQKYLSIELLGKMAIYQVFQLYNEAKASDDPKAVAEATRALARLPLWLRDPELHALEREARSEMATARIIEAHARREAAEAARLESRARRAAAAPAVPVGADLVSARPDPVPVGADLVSARLASPAGADIVSDRLDLAGADPPAEVKFDAPNSAKTPNLVMNPAPQVKSLPAESMAQPQASPRQPVAQGRRKLPKAARKAATAAGGRR